MVITFLLSLFFVKNHKGARSVLLITSTGIIFTKFIASYFNLVVYSGLVALTHTLLWPICLVYLVKDYFKIKSKIYRNWALFTILIILISLIFDFRDSFIYLNFIIKTEIFGV